MARSVRARRAAHDPTDVGRGPWGVGAWERGSESVALRSSLFARTPHAPRPTSVGVAAGPEHQPEGLHHDLDVEEGGPVLDVVEVVARALLDRGVAAQPVDLGPAGDARLLVVAVAVARDR